MQMSTVSILALTHSLHETCSKTHIFANNCEETSNLVWRCSVTWLIQIIIKLDEVEVSTYHSAGSNQYIARKMPFSELLPERAVANFRLLYTAGACI
jgi:hypothetical protein